MFLVQSNVFSVIPLYWMTPQILNSLSSVCEEGF